MNLYGIKNRSTIGKAIKIADGTATSDTLAEIQLMETVKASLDFLVREVLK